MSLTATYDQANARVELVTNGLVTAGTTIFSIQRGPTALGPWTGVRGAVNQTVTVDTDQTWYDYEYEAGPGTTNYYRVIAQDGPELVGYGSVGSDAATPVDLTMTWHASTQPGDVLVLATVGSISSSGPTIFYDLHGQNGWIFASAWAASNGVAVWFFVKEVVAGDTYSTTLTYSSTPGDMEFVGQIATFRNVNPNVLNSGRYTDQPATTNLVRYAPLPAPDENHSLVVVFGGAEGAVWSSASPPAGFTIIDDPTFFSALGASLAWAYQIQGSASALSSGDFTAASGSYSETQKLGASLMLSYDPTNATSSELFADDVDTPLTEVWLKDPLRPPRNTVVEVASPSQIRMASRSGLFDIKDRADPIEISDIRRSKSWTQRWVYRTFTELDSLVELFASGRTLFLHVPARGSLPDCPPWPRNLPGGYISVGDLSQEEAPDVPIPGTLTAPVQEVAAPSPELGYLEEPTP
jgi:hypothetical protein